MDSRAAISLLRVALLRGRGLLLLIMVGVSSGADTERDWRKEQQFWSFQPPRRHDTPSVKDAAWPTQPLDFFVLAELEARSLKPAGPAARRTLLRRVTFDLTGLPPTPDEMERFLADSLEDAYARLVQRLIEGRSFGEHFASMWLPLARYAEDQAHQVGDDTKFFYPNAFKYRAWVIDSFNRDLPYDQFLRYQLAADQFDGGKENLPALGFLGLGPKYYDRGRVAVMADEWEDRIDTVTRTTLGLTVACARCHDHKFDPITSADYYALAGVFASTRMVNKSPEGTEDGKDATKDGKGAAEDGKNADADKMHPKTLHMVEDGKPEDLNIFLRGNPERKGEIVPRRFLRILSPCDPQPFKEGSGRRELAEAIASVRNPLTARVFVNRVWGVMFGQPLVSTPSNFGHSGQPPNHVQLLDDLAVRFMENEWSLKWLVREIALSATYRQGSAGNSGLGNDPENVLLWRMNRKRLSIEQWRDTVLFVSGSLSDRGGKSMELDNPRNHRRTVYGRVSRLKLNDTLMQFDYPDANVHAEKRAVTTTPIQKLFVLNSPFALERAADFVRQLGAGDTEEKGLEAKIDRAYALLFGRAPGSRERTAALEFLAKPESGEFSRWEQYAQVLLASNEFLYVD